MFKVESIYFKDGMFFMCGGGNKFSSVFFFSFFTETEA